MPRELPPPEELTVAMQVIHEFGQSIQNADAKAGVLAAMLGLLLAVSTSDLDLLQASVNETARAPLLAAGLLGTFVISLLAAGACLGMTQVPRLLAARSSRRLAFPAVASSRNGRLGRPRVTELRDEAWCQVQALAAIARLKFRYLRWGLFGCGLCAAAFIAWLVVVVAMPTGDS